MTGKSDSVLEHSFFSDMIHLTDGSSARASSWDRTGGNADMFHAAPGETLELANIPGAGCIRHVYFTIGGPEHYLRGMVLRMYWDGEKTPSVETPFGDFFGMGHERVRFFRSLLVTVNPGANGLLGTHGFNSYFLMPFANGARITLTNEGSEPVGAVWYHIDYEKLDKIPEDTGRFHAQWRRENPTTAVGDKKNTALHEGVNLDGKENYVILEAQGHGNLAGYFLNIDNLVGGWYGEGDDMIFIDDDTWPPSFHGTGSEEIFGGGACPNTEYAGPYTGFYLVGNKDFSGKVSMYRFFVTDPIRFRKSIRVSIEHGHANNMANDYSSTAFWYQSEPHGPFPALLPLSERLPRWGNDTHDRAYKGLFDMQRKFQEAMRLYPERKVEPPKDDVAAFLAVYNTISESFDKQDYETAFKRVDEANAMIDKLLRFVREAQAPKP
jgi:hypothetical protein